MAHLRKSGWCCDVDGCTVRESVALYGARNDLYGNYCKRHASEELRALQAREDADHGRVG